MTTLQARSDSHHHQARRQKHQSLSDNYAGSYTAYPDCIRPRMIADSISKHREMPARLQGIPRRAYARFHDAQSPKREYRPTFAEVLNQDQPLSAAASLLKRSRNQPKFRPDLLWCA